MTISPADWKHFEGLLNLALDRKLKPLYEKITHLPDKQTFYHYMDKWMQAASTADIEKPLHKAEHDRLRAFLDRYVPRV